MDGAGGAHAPSAPLGPLTAVLQGIDGHPQACYPQAIERLQRTGQARKAFKNINLTLFYIKGNILMSPPEAAKTWNPCAAQPLSHCVPPLLSLLFVPHILG